MLARVKRAPLAGVPEALALGVAAEAVVLPIAALYKTQTGIRINPTRDRATFTYLERGEGLAGGRGVDGEDHALSTVADGVGLRAEEPERAGGVVHGEAPLRDLGRVGGDGLEARVDAREGGRP